jgi:hypothetical protein
LNEDEADTPTDEYVNVASGKELKTYHKAISSSDQSEWESVMESELNSIAQLETNQLVKLLPN